jgi:hypothetical protein
MEMTSWTKNNKWIWRTTPFDAGLNEILVVVRDGKHAGPGGSDDYAIASYLVAPVSINQPPKIISVGTNVPSTQPAGATVKWTAKALDSEGNRIYYRYWLKGPSTGGFWRMVRDWSTDNTWTWATSLADAGTSQMDCMQVQQGLMMMQTLYLPFWPPTCRPS